MRPILLILAAVLVGAEPIDPPRGIFTSSGSREPVVVAHPQVGGCLVRVTWSDLEPEPGRLDRQRIDEQLAPLRAAGKGWSLGVIAGPHAPAWLYQGPESVTGLDIDFRGKPMRVPCFWDARLQQRLAALMRSLGAAYRDDAGLRLVYVPQMSANGIEGHFNGNDPQALARQGLTPERWTQAALDACRSCAAAFPRTAVAIELHELLGSTDIPQRIMAGITADPALARQVGVAVWWLSGRTSYQGGLLEAIAAFPGEKYGQLIARSDRARSFPPGGFAEAFVQARALGMRYVEPWEFDVKSGQWDTVLADFNSWAKTGR
jgi:hypothetical protein